MIFENIIGQDLAKQCLKSMIEKQEDAPRYIIISGPYGTGRKSLALEYITNIKLEGEEYKEYDYSQIDEINEGDYIVITNFEKCKRTEQMCLYNKLNNLKHVIIISEDTDNIIDNLMNISLILRTSLISYDKISEYLIDRTNKLNINISKEDIDIISKRSKGHISDAIKMLDNYSLLDEVSYKEMIMSAREYYICFLISCYIDNREYVDKYINKLRELPLVYLKIDYEALILEIMRVVTKFEKPKDNYMIVLNDKIKTKALELYYILNDKVIYNSFTSSDAFQSALYVIYLKLNNRLR